MMENFRIMTRQYNRPTIPSQKPLLIQSGSQRIGKSQPASRLQVQRSSVEKAENAYTTQPYQKPKRRLISSQKFRKIKQQTTANQEFERRKEIAKIDQLLNERSPAKMQNYLKRLNSAYGGKNK